jgi:hypothetical protein
MQAVFINIMKGHNQHKTWNTSAYHDEARVVKQGGLS